VKLHPYSQVRCVLSDSFNGKEPSNRINLDQAVALQRYFYVGC
jgi:hypothetical protein